jgi:FkbM family methyltransferase
MRPALVRSLKAWVGDHVPIGRLSYAQEGEDLVLARMLDALGVSRRRHGFFVDVGAHHPTRFSNTYYFYRRGWRGINVDAMPGTRKLFQRVRPRDITVESGVGARAGMMTYFLFNEPALNTFSEQEATRKNQGPYRIIGTAQIPVVPLKEILDEHVPPAVSIDFMNIDAEGFDHEIVCSNDWQRYRPTVVLLELLNTTMEGFGDHPTAQILRECGYRLIAKTFNTFFFTTK